MNSTKIIYISYILKWYMANFLAIMIGIWLFGAGYFIEYKQSFKISTGCDMFIGIASIMAFIISFLYGVYFESYSKKTNKLNGQKSLKKITLFYVVYCLYLVFFAYILLHITNFLFGFILRPELNIFLFSGIFTLIVVLFVTYYFRISNKILDFFTKL